MKGSKVRTSRVRPHPGLRGLFQGRKAMNLPIEPPQFNETPMYPLTVEIRKPYDAQVAYNVTPKILADAIRQQFGGIEKGEICLRLFSFGLWGIADASSTAPEVNVDVSGLSALANDNVTPTAPVGIWYGITAKLRDVGTLNRPCKVGYTWSVADNTKVIPEGATFEILNWAMAGTATSVLRVKLMFNFGGSAAPQGP